MKKVHLEAIIRLAKAHRIEEPFSSYSALERFLKFWWCQTYNKPLKDPILLSYTIDELAYEFFRHFYNKPENDPNKERKDAQAVNEDEEWVKRELASIKAAEQVSKEIIEQTKKSLADIEALTETVPEGVSIKFDE